MTIENKTKIQKLNGANHAAPKLKPNRRAYLKASMSAE
jgi:hypothetical protein